MRPGSLPWRVRYRLRYGFTAKTRARRMMRLAASLWPLDPPADPAGVLRRLVLEDPSYRDRLVDALFFGIVAQKKTRKEPHAHR